MRFSWFVSFALAFAIVGCGKKKTETTVGTSTANANKPEPEDPLDTRAKKFFADLKSNSLDRRQTAVDSAARLEADGGELIGELIDLLKDTTAAPLGDSSLERPKSTREGVVLSLLKIGAPGKKALLDKGLKILQDGLNDPKPTVREHTASAIGMIGPDAKPALPALVKLCGDKESAVRSATYRSLERIKNPPALPIVKLLSDPEPGICTDASLALGWLKPQGEEVVAPLIAALKSEALEKKSPAAATTVRYAAAEALAGVGKGAEKAVPELIELVKKTDVEKMEMAMKQGGAAGKKPSLAGHVLALRKIGSPAIPALTELLKDKEPVIRYQAAAALGGMGKRGESALPAVMAALDGERNLGTGQMYVFEEIATAALSLGGDAKQVLNPLAMLLRDDDPIVKARALGLLKRFGRKGASTIPRVTELLADLDERVRRSAAEALGEMGPAAKDAATELSRHLNGEDIQLARAAVTALEGLGPDAAVAVPDLIKALGSNNQSYTTEVVRTLGAIGPAAEPALDSLLKLFDDKTLRLDEKQELLKAISAIGPKAAKAVPVVAKAMSDKDVNTRLIAAEALVKIGSGNADAIKRLVEGLKDSSLSTQIASAKGLATMGDKAKSAATDLKAIAEKGKDGEMKIWAAAALCAMGIEVDTHFKPIQAAIKDKTPAARAARNGAVDSFWVLGTKSKLLAADINDALKDKTPGVGTSPSVRERAATSIGRMGPAGKEFVSGLSELLRDSDPKVRKASLIALTAIGPDAVLAVPRIRDLLSDENLESTAQKALDRIEPSKKD